MIAEAATLCFAMFASTARASRSYCIGLRNADQEIHLAQCFCCIAGKRVKEIAVAIDNGEYGTSEHTFKTIGQQLIESKDYHLEHPTARNFYFVRRKILKS
jgi:acyl-CoA dehydrogenase family member 9